MRYYAIDYALGFRHREAINSQEAAMTEEQTNHLTDARAIVAAAMTILAGNLTGDHRSPADMVAALLDKAAEDLRQVAQAA